MRFPGWQCSGSPGGTRTALVASSRDVKHRLFEGGNEEEGREEKRRGQREEGKEGGREGRREEVNIYEVSTMHLLLR